MKNQPSKVNLSFINFENINFSEGDSISIEIDNFKIFYGYIFTKLISINSISITAYDQIRYLIARDTYIYKNKTASQIISMLCADFGLQKGVVEDTKYNISYRVEENQRILDIIYTALDFTTKYNKEQFILFDDFGKICLKNIKNMKINTILDIEKNPLEYYYTSSIDKDVYNSVKISVKSKKNKVISTFHKTDENNRKKWGTLRLFKRLPNTFTKAQAENYAKNLLELKNRIKEQFEVTDFGNPSIRGGSVLNVKFKNSISSMIVESCIHTIKNNEHTMKLILSSI